MKIIVADDEFFSRKALVMMLGKLGTNVSICGDCENGWEVLELLETVTPDLIITDIRMPRMDGLQLAAYIQEHEPETDLMIVTGYADFEYARQAIRYGVKEYLMKPVKESELREGILRIEETRGRKNREEGLRLLPFSYILGNERLETQILDWKEEEETSSYYMLLISGEEKEASIWHLGSLLERSGAFNRVKSLFFRNGKEGILLLFPSGERPGFSRQAALSPWMKRAFPDGGVWAGGSGLHRGKKELEAAYRECIYAVNERILKPGALFCYNPGTEIRDVVTKREEESLRSAVEKGDEKEALKIIGAIFAGIRREENVYTLFAALTRILFVLSHAFHPGKEQAERYLFFDFKVDLYQYTSFESIWDYVTMAVRDFCRKEQEETPFIIENLLEYLERNYACDISLQDLAENKYFVSASYLSRLFKAHTGETFSRYLIRLRMKKAREFLECSLMDIGDIAACTGYNDASHFAQTFRKTFGISPKEYRKACLRGRQGVSEGEAPGQDSGREP